MRHLFVAAMLLLAALVVTLGAAALLENMASYQRPEPDNQPYVPGGTTSPAQSPAPAGKPPPPEQSRSLSLLRRT